MDTVVVAGNTERVVVGNSEPVVAGNKQPAVVGNSELLVVGSDGGGDDDAHTHTHDLPTRDHVAHNYRNQHKIAEKTR
ncbi:MAG: hypothetical protein LUO95_07170 [Methylococcaceae bacterium]|nr:hypothetical protein [Methylococcaceae bacterium]MDD1616680.1 hypothetical protein [Methylococcaceae bacterium]